MFWVLSSLLILVVAAAVLWPLLRPSVSRDAIGGRDVDVYAAQLAELKADVRRGIMGPTEAVAARAEIGRRLLRAAASQREQGDRHEPKGAVAFGLAVALLVPAAALAAYAGVGSPEQPDRPLALRQTERPASGADFEAMVAAAEERLAGDPEDGRGWDVLAPIYARLGDLPKADTAYRQALRLLGESPARLAGLGEVLVRTAGGEVTDEARAQFERVAALDPANETARVFLALDLTQEGRRAEAAEAWTALLAEAPANAPWRPMAEAALAEARSGGPSAQAVAERAIATPDGDQQAMIQGMVEGLASRLEAEPADAEGWMRLVRAYGVLGEQAKGKAALERARRTFPTGTEEWANIADAAARAGLVVRAEPGR